MTSIVFTIPSNRNELLSEVQSNYTVKNVVIPAEIVARLADAYASLREEGPNFILDHFDTYYSVLHHGDNLRPDVINKAFKHLLKATKDLNNSLTFLLEDPESLNDDLKAQTVSVLKMLIYIYIEFVKYLEKKKESQEDNLVGKGRKQEKKNDSNSDVDKSEVLKTLNDILQREINVFWDPPILEHDFVNLISELCFGLLQNPSIKHEKEVVTHIFVIFGNMVKFYNYGKTFVSRLIQTIRMYEHVVTCVSDPIKVMVEQFSCQSLIHHLVKEATEWQADETFQDAQGTRCCSLLLTELAVIMPDLILPEVSYLDQYLGHESVPLRIAVINVFTEIIPKVLTRHDLTDEEKEIRDELFDIIIEHFYDVSALVRAKVIQNLSKLQKESAIPLSYQDEILTENVKHLRDKGAAVRKSAINAVTVSLEHNPFGATLQLKKVQSQLAEKKQLLNEMERSYREAQEAKIKHLEDEWSSIQKELEEVVKKALSEDKDDESDDEEQEEEQHQEIDKSVEEIRKYLKEKQFLEAFKLCRNLKDSIQEWKNNMPKNRDGQEAQIYIEILHAVFINRVKIIEELRTGAGMTQEDIKKLKALEEIIKYLENTESFLKIIDSAIEPMKSLLFSQSIGDMQESLQFFVRAYQFQIDNASEGILEMLKMMRCSEQERKKSIVEAFKTIYLTTDTNNMTAHTTTIVNRIIGLLKDLAYDNLDDFQSIVVEWITRGILDNNVIDRCWQYYTQREKVSNEDARAACEILRMAAMARNTIITKNIAVVSRVMFLEQHKDDYLFLGSSCRLLAVAGSEKIDIQSENAPFRIKSGDEIFQNLSNVLVDGFFLKNSYYSDAMEAAVDFICRVCSKPLDVVEDILKRIDQRMKEYPKYTFLIVRLCELLGRLAINILDYLDNSVYREMKRRNYLREERKKQEKNNKKKEKKSEKKSRSVLNASVCSEVGSTDSSILTGAEAEDADSEFIMTVLENDVVSPKSVLGQYTPFIVNICQRPDVYNDLLLQLAAVTALMRYMLVSSKFCREHMRLLFTILEKTNYPEIKSTILIHCADLLSRFPNVVEPWSPKIYDNLRDPLPEVRKKAFFSVANLILRGMIRPQSHFADMAACLIDPDAEVSGMSRSFFERLAQKEHGLVNAIPDIFTNLVRMDQVDQESLRFIMRFLFDLLDTTSKRTESLVDRFCNKYTPDDNTRLNRNITYCLSLISYNEKALRKLREMFPTYQHHLHDAEIYSTFKQILTECNRTKPGKVDLKPIVTEIETCIASVFEIGEDGQPANPPPIASKSAKKSGRGRPKKKSSRKQSDSEDEDSDEDVRQRSGKRKKSNRRQRRSSSSV